METALARPSPSPSVFQRAVSPREWRTISAALVVAGGALLLAFGVLPVGRRWTAREAQIDAARDRVARLRTLVRDADRIAAEANAGESRAASLSVRLLRGRTPALAASTLQSMLQDVAARSRVSITRLEVASAVEGAGVRVIPASLSAVTDIFGLAELLTGLQHSRMLLDVREVSVTSSSALRGDLLQVAVVVHAPFLLER